MNHTQQIIQDAIEGGYAQGTLFMSRLYEVSSDDATFKSEGMTTTLRVSQMLSKSAFWQAVGKTRGWCLHLDHYGDGECKKCFGRVRGRSYIQWHQFIDHLAEGLSIEEALAKLS